MPRINLLDSDTENLFVGFGYLKRYVGFGYQKPIC